MRADDATTMPLSDTDPPVVARDHMGRRHAATVGEAFRHDWPWIVALMLLMAFVIAAMAGYFRM